MSEPAKPILVTGAHRSGTTWVGQILATAPSVTYIHEPFHIELGPAVTTARFDYWFTYLCAANEASYLEPFRQMLDRANGRALIKDPIAVFSAAWLAARFQTTNVVVIRHPLAFAASVKVNKWAHPFGHFLQQPHLMADHLEPYASEIMRFARQPPDVVGQAALLWTLIYSVVLKYQQDFPQWIYVRHEDLMREPHARFRPLFDRLGLPYDNQTESAIDARRHLPEPWTSRLTEDEAYRVRACVGEIARHFYPEEAW